MLPPTETLAIYGAAAATTIAVAAIAMKMIKKGGETGGKAKAEGGMLKRAFKLEWLVRSSRKDRSIAKLADQLDALDKLRDKADRDRD